MRRRGRTITSWCRRWWNEAACAAVQGDPMCLICEQEDLYFLYLERLDRARKAARGETAPPNPNWLWPELATASPAGAAEQAPTPRRAEPKPGFACDTPGE